MRPDGNNLIIFSRTNWRN